MAITECYITLANLKEVLEIDAAITSYDTSLTIAINSVCRLIDAKTGRRFYTTTSAETRAYTPQSYKTIWVPDDINSLTSLKTDEDGDGTYENTWATSDYSLEPTNATLDSKPYTHIKTKIEGDYTFPIHVPNSVQLVGKFGWGATSAVPDVVKQAALIQCSRIYLRKNTPFGVAGAAEFGTIANIPKLDPDVEQMLLPVTRRI